MWRNTNTKRGGAVTLASGIIERKETTSRQTGTMEGRSMDLQTNISVSWLLLSLPLQRKCRAHCDASVTNEATADVAHILTDTGMQKRRRLSPVARQTDTSDTSPPRETSPRPDDVHDMNTMALMPCQTPGAAATGFSGFMFSWMTWETRRATVLSVDWRLFARVVVVSSGAMFVNVARRGVATGESFTSGMDSARALPLRSLKAAWVSAECIS